MIEVYYQDESGEWKFLRRVNDFKFHLDEKQAKKVAKVFDLNPRDLPGKVTLLLTDGTGRGSHISASEFDAAEDAMEKNL